MRSFSPTVKKRWREQQVALLISPLMSRRKMGREVDGQSEGAKENLLSLKRADDSKSWRDIEMLAEIVMSVEKQ